MTNEQINTKPMTHERQPDILFMGLLDDRQECFLQDKENSGLTSCLTEARQDEYINNIFLIKLLFGNEDQKILLRDGNLLVNKSLHKHMNDDNSLISVLARESYFNVMGHDKNNPILHLVDNRKGVSTYYDITQDSEWPSRERALLKFQSKISPEMVLDWPNGNIISDGFIAFMNEFYNRADFPSDIRPYTEGTNGANYFKETIKNFLYEVGEEDCNSDYITINAYRSKKLREQTGKKPTDDLLHQRNHSAPRDKWEYCAKFTAIKYNQAGIFRKYMRFANTLYHINLARCYCDLSMGVYTNFSMDFTPAMGEIFSTSEDNDSYSRIPKFCIPPDMYLKVRGRLLVELFDKKKDDFVSLKKNYLAARANFLQKGQDYSNLKRLTIDYRNFLLSHFGYNRTADKVTTFTKNAIGFISTVVSLFSQSIAYTLVFTIVANNPIINKHVAELGRCVASKLRGDIPIVTDIYSVQNMTIFMKPNTMLFCVHVPKLKQEST